MSAAGVQLTSDESCEVELLADRLAESTTAREQIAGELVVLRKLFARCRDYRYRLPPAVQRELDRFPRYSRTVEFHLKRASNELELEP